MKRRFRGICRSTASSTFFCRANFSTSPSEILGASSTDRATTFVPSRIRIERSSLLPFMANWMRPFTSLYFPALGNNQPPANPRCPQPLETVYLFPPQSPPHARTDTRKLLRQEPLLRFRVQRPPTHQPGQWRARGLCELPVRRLQEALAVRIRAHLSASL